MHAAISFCLSGIKGIIRGLRKKASFILRCEFNWLRAFFWQASANAMQNILDWEFNRLRAGNLCRCGQFLRLVNLGTSKVASVCVCWALLRKQTRLGLRIRGARFGGNCTFSVVSRTFSGFFSLLIFLATFFSFAFSVSCSFLFLTLRHFRAFFFLTRNFFESNKIHIESDFQDEFFFWRRKRRNARKTARK